MALFRRSKDPTRALAEAIAKRGVRARGTVEALTPTGEINGPAREIEFDITFELEGTGEPTRVKFRQWMNDPTLTGLAPGEPVDISYDRDDPTTVMVWG